MDKLAVAAWLCAVFEVLEPRGDFKKWYKRVCAPRLGVYQTGRNWRRIWEFIVQGYLPIKMILSGDTELTKAVKIGLSLHQPFKTGGVECFKTERRCHLLVITQASLPQTPAHSRQTGQREVRLPFHLSMLHPSGGIGARDWKP